MSNSKQFYQYVIPSIGGMLVVALYFVVDGIFVGRGVGTEALASVNIAVPFISVLTAVTMMLTMGGATIASIHFGKGENEKANNTFNTTVLLILGFSIFMTVISLLFPIQIAKALGASDLLLHDTATYIRYYVLFGIFLCGSIALATFVKNDGNPTLAFWGMMVGAISNIFLDWLFIFPLEMGVMGAAIASGLGQVLSCAVLSIHFIRKEGIFRLEKPKKQQNLIMQVIKTGTPEFITQMSQPVTILCYNFIVLRAFGEMGVSAFSVISYLLFVTLGIFIGLAQGIQPLISYSFGEGNKEKEKYFFKKGLQFSIILSSFIYVLMLLFGKQIIAIFSSDTNLLRIAYEGLSIYGISFIFASINIVYTTYCLATKRTKNALIISILRSFVFNSIFIFAMPIAFGEKWIWAGVIVAEILVMIVAISINKEDIPSPVLCSQQAGSTPLTIRTIS